MVAEPRIGNGRQAFADNRGLLNGVEQRFGVSARTITAIWGIETNYGTTTGGFAVIQALATLAHDGRRSTFFRGELLSALRILDQGHIALPRMTGSWAGAMGHTQFMPTSWVDHAVDFTGDGRRDIWSDDPTDALASTANYLARSGWRRGQPWGVEVRLPEGFNYGSADQSNLRPAAEWRARGVTLVGGQPLPDHGAAATISTNRIG